MTSSPRYPRSNGLAEKMFRTVQTMTKKCKKNHQDIQLAMLNLRVTPINNKLPSPADLILGRSIPTMLPSHHNTPQANEENYNILQDKCKKLKADHDQTAGPALPPLYVGQKVRVQHPKNKTWEPAEVADVCKESRSYIFNTPNGALLRRNRSHIRKMPNGVLRTTNHANQKIQQPKTYHQQYPNRTKRTPAL